MEIGPLLKKIRNSKNMTQESLATGIISRSHLSELENSNYYCSYDKFILLLRKLNVSLMEFEELLNQSIFFEEESLLKKLMQANNSQNERDLKMVQKKINSYIKKSNNPSSRIIHAQILCEAIIEYRKHGKICNPERFAPLKEYLTACNDWGYYEINLLNNSLFVYDVDTAITLSSSLIMNCQKTQSVMTKEVLILTLINMSDYLLKLDLNRESLKYSRLAIKLCENTNRLFEKCLASINAALAQTKIDKSPQPKIETWIEFLRFSGYHDLANQIDKEVADIVLD
ncbi:Rgg/GadR/MutR family transcriptional activator [Enterococcus rotai]|uniref:Transcriptional activator, Rgg/GadR/MutR family domain-containing protein n=2 Tax=Enterococcus TaxID=1350 RepID=R2Q6T5_9ENTE|nr:MULTISPECIES: Rgg/GadR/MutR family transcriptional regulator [Enterococcus]ALS38446.1 hypothetical protein ATZ35_15205 [Enterococcus rotai]EOH92237.1 transcriptional activator, Rgg/GadR/MutR family domain-containing protein [Enterococcus haemoperoxidus ATCC BAA-382]EOT61922.1 hypothetical protein I583_00905 [Enterococcus haemoperoxidus ATCC BAA-382]OJG54169.1 transcriptional activator, Rgg/GadR/MutR family domain-containing protein [Enterococcus haemoperoxidus]